MTTKTKRLAFFSLLVLALTLPAETILLKALQAPSDAVAIKQWAQQLDDQSLTNAAARIESYPFSYRRAIMGALAPAARATVWRSHIESYIAQHGELNTAAISALQSVESTLTPTALSLQASNADRLAISAAANQVQSILGKDTAKQLMYYLGPQDGTFASLEPVTMKLASYVRHSVQLLANYDSCDCAMWYGCDSGTACTNNQYCEAVTYWPMCAWFWNYPCDGLCMSY
jgi:hypothetical protein